MESNSPLPRITLRDAIDVIVKNNVDPDYFYVDEAAQLLNSLHSDEDSNYGVTRLKNIISDFNQSKACNWQNIANLKRDMYLIRHACKDVDSTNANQCILKLVHQLNSSDARDREDVITEKVKEFCRNCTDKSKEILDALCVLTDQHHWDLLNRKFYQKPSLSALILDLYKVVLKHTTIPEEHKVDAGSGVAINFLDVINSGLFRPMLVNTKIRAKNRWFNQQAMNILYRYRHHKDEAIFQILLLCLVRYGVSTADTCENLLFASTVQFVRENYIRPETPKIVEAPVFSTVEVLEDDDPIKDVVKELVKNLCKDRTGSSLAPYILEYETLVSDFDAKGKQICTLIDFALTKYGWKKGHAFQVKPDINGLVAEITEFLNDRL